MKNIPHDVSMWQQLPAGKLPTLASLCLALCISACATADTGGSKAALLRSIEISRAAPLVTVPLEVRKDKLFITAEANGQSREFIFDTGTPTILDRALADRIHLKTISKSTGRDGNGRAIEMDFALLERLVIGGISFSNVPVLIFDFSAIDPGKCLFDGGAIGSEILAGSAWRIDAQNQRLEIADRADRFEVHAPQIEAHLFDHGYPHSPVVEYSLGANTDRALFDTGSAPAVSLFAKLLDDTSVQGAIIAGSQASGRGSEGISAGGLGQVVDLTHFSLARLGIGDGELTGVQGVSRTQPPSLLGARLLDAFIVTLDYPGARFAMERRSRPEATNPMPGYGVSIVEGRALVTQLFVGSRADHAGLRLHDVVVAIDGQRIPPVSNDNLCAQWDWLRDSLQPSQGATVTVLRDGRESEVVLPPAEG